MFLCLTRKTREGNRAWHLALYRLNPLGLEDADDEAAIFTRKAETQR